MGYYKDMTIEEYVDSYLTESLPKSEIETFELRLFDDEALIKVFDERQPVHEALKLSFDEWSANKSFILLKLFIDGEFVREFRVLDKAAVTAERNGKYELKDPEGAVVYENVVRLKKPDRKSAKSEESGLLKKAASSVFKEGGEEVFYKGQKITIELFEE
jgi:hypothetical protein